MTVARFIAVAAIIGLAPTAGAQRVSGIVRDSASREPLPGAVVTLLDSAGRLSSRMITSREGRYSLPVIGAVRRVRVVRIGFRPQTIALSIRYPAPDTTLDITLAALPTLLEAVEVSDRLTCPRRDDRLAALSLWEQARDGLLATVVARESNSGMLHSIVYDRTLDRLGRKILRQTVHHDSLDSSRPFIAARPAAEFGDAGYVEETDGDRAYYAPDADGLLDPAFAELHCFSLRHDKRDHPGEIGLAFEPASDRNGIVDVTGVLWIDSVTPALRTLDFRYTNIEPAARDAGAGGSLSFRAASNGVVVIDRWNLHVPGLSPESKLLQLRGQPGLLRARRTVTDVHDIGAQIASARWPDGTEWRAPLGSLRGQVTMPSDKRPVAGALVWLVNTDDSTRTDADGTFALTRLLPGPYDVFAADSVAAPFHFRQNWEQIVSIDSTKSTLAQIELRRLTDVIADVCENDPRARSSVLVLADIVLGEGSPASNAEVRASWTAGERHVRFEGSAGTAGTLRICGVPSGSWMQIIARIDSLNAEMENRFELPSGTPLVARHLVIPTALPAYRERLLGVYDEVTGEPVSDVAIVDLESGKPRATTSRTGTASLVTLPRGRASLSLRRDGYETKMVTVLITPSKTEPITVTMKKLP